VTHSGSPESGDVLEWTVHLARRRPRQAAAVVVVILAASLVAGLGFRSALFGALAAVLLVASVSDYLLPVHYRLDGAGARAAGVIHRRRMGWEQVRRAARDSLGVKLSPLGHPSRLEAYRGIYLWFAGNESEVMAAVARHVGRGAGVGAPELADGDVSPPA